MKFQAAWHGVCGMVILDYSCACQQWKNKTIGTKEILKAAVSGEKKGTKELRVSAKPCAAKFITVDEFH